MKDTRAKGSKRYEREIGETLFIPPRYGWSLQQLIILIKCKIDLYKGDDIDYRDFNQAILDHLNYLEMLLTKREP